ncbi:unnamed protein product [Pedinophyceae sp. YPF-701]|nr:unnamed protein product [Pedinophyceae sp. YPF-701]
MCAAEGDFINKPYDGVKQGYVYKTGDRGVGYYRDDAPAKPQPPVHDDAASDDEEGDVDHVAERRRREAERLKAEDDALVQEDPIFWHRMPENPERNPTYRAMKELQDELTPRERAEAAKKEGNTKLQTYLRSKNRFYLNEAVTMYTKGVEEKVEDAQLNCLLLANRAQCHLYLGNHRRCVEDARRAIGHDAKYIKAYFRAARSLLALGELEECEAVCAAGLDVEDAPELRDIRSAAQQRRAAAAEKKRRETEEAERKARPARALAALLAQRGYRFTLPQFAVGATRRPWAEDAAGVSDPPGPLDPAQCVVHFPGVFMYPERGAQDAVEDMEEGVSVGAHVDAMLDPGAPPAAWDPERDYRPETVEVYYMAYAGRELSTPEVVEAMQGRWPDAAGEAEAMGEAGPRRYGKHAARWVRVDLEKPLGGVLQEEGCIVPGVPVFFVVRKGTEYRDKFLDSVNA